MDRDKTFKLEFCELLNKKYNECVFFDELYYTILTKYFDYDESTNKYSWKEDNDAEIS